MDISNIQLQQTDFVWAAFDNPNNLEDTEQRTNRIMQKGTKQQ